VLGVLLAVLALAVGSAGLGNVDLGDCCQCLSTTDLINSSVPSDTTGATRVSDVYRCRRQRGIECWANPFRRSARDQVSWRPAMKRGFIRAKPILRLQRDGTNVEWSFGGDRLSSPRRHSHACSNGRSLTARNAAPPSLDMPHLSQTIPLLHLQHVLCCCGMSCARRSRHRHRRIVGDCSLTRVAVVVSPSEVQGRGIPLTILTDFFCVVSMGKGLAVLLD
jgi:hypothetical protein